MEAIESKTIVAGGDAYRITIYYDEDSPNPLDDWSEMGTILSLNRRHRNFEPDRIVAAVEHDVDAVKLSYFEHGRCLWSVAGEQPAAARCPWNSVPFAGVWLPDAITLASAACYAGRTRELFLRKRARDACNAYSKWCNGDVYGYIVERIVECPTCDESQIEKLSSCWGFCELDECRSDAIAAVKCSIVNVEET